VRGRSVWRPPRIWPIAVWTFVVSYGRAPTFLLATGYEQARSVVAALVGGGTPDRQVPLDLPQTG
jgi:hypothetical protein